MKTCKNYQEKLVLYLYNELTEPERKDLAKHLQSCADCQEELSQLQLVHETIPQHPPELPEEATLQLLRNSISGRIRGQRQKRIGAPRSMASIFQPAPLLKFGLALFIFTAGFFTGTRFGIRESNQDFSALEPLLTANQQIQSGSSEINPLLAGIKKLQYDPKTGSIEVYYTTVNEVYLEGKMENPTVRNMLRKAILEEGNPAVRLHAVKVVKSIAEKEVSIESEIIEALTLLIGKEQNVGVRLKVLKVLKALLPNPFVKIIIFRVLLHDPNPALRIEAMDAILKTKLSKEDVNIFRKVAKQDSNTYIISQAKRVIENFEKSSPSQQSDDENNLNHKKE